MLKAFHNIMDMVKIIHKASPWSFAMALMYKLWVTFVQLVFMTLLSRYLINAYVLNKPYFEVLIIIFVLWITQIGYSVFSNYYEHVFKPISEERVSQYIQKRIFLKSISVNLSMLDDPEYYNDFTKASIEAKTRAIRSQDLLMNALADFTALFVLLYVVVKIHIGFLFIVLIPVLLNIGFGKILDRLTFESDSKAVKADRKVNYVNRAFFLKGFSKEIKTSNIKNVLLSQFKEAIEDIIRVRKKYGKPIAAIKIVTILVNDVVSYLVAVVLAWSLLRNSNIIMGDFVFVITSLSTVCQRLQNCIDDGFQIYNSKNYILNLKSFLFDSTKQEENKERTAVMPFKQIEVRRVVFKYNKDAAAVLNDISLCIDSGKRIAIIGNNGSGKTTLVKILLGLYDVTKGEVLLNGSLIHNYNINEYRSLFSCVFQDYALFGCTVGENILCREVLEEDRPTVFEALKMSGLYDDMVKNDISIDSMVTKEFDEQGIIFSGGQLQKLAIARALANDRPIVILDEPSSALDPIAEYEMFEKFKSVFKNKTLIYITHRSSAFVLADTICLFEDGRITEMGTHDELMSLNRKYANMYLTQSSQYHNN